MEIQGKICDPIEVKEGIAKSSGNPWKTATVVIEHGSAEYPKKAAVEFWGDKVDIVTRMLSEGDTISVQFDVDSRQSPQGYWNTSCRAWKFDVIEKGEAAATGDERLSEATADNDDDPPF